MTCFAAVLLVAAAVCLFVAKGSVIVHNEDCTLSNSWCTVQSKLQSLALLKPSKWGSFRPGNYFGFKSKTDGAALGTGILWTSSVGQGKPMRDQTQQDELTRFEWTRHDGKRFGIESIVDNGYDMDITASFVVPESQNDTSHRIVDHVPEWFQKLEVKPAHGELRTDVSAGSHEKKSLVFYMGTECTESTTVDCLAEAQARGWKVTHHRGSAERGFNSAVSVIGHTKTTGWFCLFMIVQQKSSGNHTDSVEEPSVSYVGLKDVNLQEGTERLKADAKMAGFGGADNINSGASTRRGRKQLRASIFDDFGDLNNEVEDEASFVGVHVGFTGSVRVDALLYAHLAISSGEELAGLIGQAEIAGEANVLPFAMSTALTVSHRSLTRLSVPTGTSTPCSSAVVQTDGEVTDATPSTAAKDLTRTSGQADDHSAVSERAPAGPLVRSKCANRGECIRHEVDQLLLKHSAAFDDHFHAVFPFVSSVVDADAGESGAEVPVFTENDIEAAKVCLSSVLGGMGYFQGRPSIGIAADVGMDSGERALSEVTKHNQLVKAVNDQSSLVSLFTATPSRTSFPRGFLWDEGFHQMLISQWSPALSMEVIASWLQAMHFPCDAKAGDKSSQKCPGGWIPREMILGEEARRRVPDEFVVQRVNIANPPTFLLVVESLLDRFESAVPPARTAAQGRGPASLPPVTGTDLTPSSEEIKADEIHTNTEVMKRYRKELDPRDAQLVLLQHSEDRAVVLSYLRDVYPLLHRWVQWFLHSQKGSDAYPGSFRWRGRSQSDGKVIPNTLASGLDDYPRSPVPTADEHHVDLHCWMVKATGVMARLEKVLKSTGYALPPESEAMALMAQYQTQHEYLLQRLDELHWSAEHHGYFDVGKNSEDSHFSQELVFRCSNPRDQSTTDVAVPMEAMRQRRQDFCPPSHPKPLFAIGDGQGNYKMIERLVMPPSPPLSHIPRVGYVAIFPLLLRLLDPYSPKLGAVLDMVEDPQKLWTDHGLRSLALTDKFYQRRNSPGDAPYWRGPIWIPINYLALGALHHYASVEGVYQARAQRLYSALRNNVLQTVLGQYAATGHFWEQYEDTTGAGMRGHPFTGWTALVVNIMAERY